MWPNCDGNAYGSAGGAAFRVRPDKGWQPWTRPDGRTVEAADAGREFRTSFWIGEYGESADYSIGSYVNSSGKTVYYVSRLENYVETKSATTRGRYHHFIDLLCDRLMFAQNCHLDANGDLQIPAPRWFAPRRAAAPSPSAAERGRRPFCSPASSIEGLGGVWASKRYADWREAAAAKHTTRAWEKHYHVIPEDPDTPQDPQKPFWWADIAPESRKGIVADAIARDLRREGTGFDPEEIGNAIGQDWSGVSTTELLYTVGGNARTGYHPIYWREVSQAATNYDPSFLVYGLIGEGGFTNQDALPEFMKGTGDDILSQIDPDTQGLAFDLCVLFRTYKYKTRDFQAAGGAGDVQSGYFNTFCEARARVVAPCPPAAT